MNKKLQIFVSSTYTDLIEERQAAVEAILDAGHIPAGMELFKAGKSQMQTIRKWIDESDVYMLILGGRYGSIEEESGLSYTELEYQYALSKNMPVFAIVLDDSFLYEKASANVGNIIFEKDNEKKYNAFKNKVMSQIVQKIKNIDQIASKIHGTLNSILKDDSYNLIGWIRSDSSEFDFNSLKKAFDRAIINNYKTNPEDANQYLIYNFPFFNIGYDSSYFTNASLFVETGILDVKTRNGIEIYKFSSLGYKYYLYLLSTLSSE